MEDEIDYDPVEPRDFANRGGDRFKPRAPTFATMTGDEDAQPSVVGQYRWRERPFDFQRGVDPAVAGDVDRAGRAFRGKIGGGASGRREQQRSHFVDPDSIFLLGPGRGAVVAAQPRFDVGDRHAGFRGRERGAHRARGVALDDNEVWAFPKTGRKRARHLRHVPMGIGLPGDADVFHGQVSEFEITGVEIGMLTRQDQPRDHAAPLERLRHRSQFYCFGPGADDQPDVGETQTSP